MPRYAYFDSNAPSPQPVLGWFDTDLLNYTNLPSAENLLELTNDEWNGRLAANPSGWAVADGALVVAPPPTPPPPTVDDILAGKIAAGIAITSVSNPGLDCTMALDAQTMAEIGSVARDVSSGMGFPADLPVFIYPDITGQPRMFDEAQVVALYKVQRDLLFSLNTQAAIMRHGGPPDWPPQTGSIP